MESGRHVSHPTLYNIDVYTAEKVSCNIVVNLAAIKKVMSYELTAKVFINMYLLH